MTASPQRDPYRVLGVEPQASAEEVARAYRGMVRRHHPDSRGPGGDGLAHDRALREVMSAYAALRSRSDGAAPAGAVTSEPGDAGSPPPRATRVRVRRPSHPAPQPAGPTVVAGPTWREDGEGRWRPESPGGGPSR